MDKRKILANILSGKTPISSTPRIGLLQIGATKTEGMVIVNGEEMSIADAKKRIRRAAMVLFWHRNNLRVPAELISDKAYKVSFRKPRPYIDQNN